MIKKCPHCGSIWVTWNWIYSNESWFHECWDCDDAFMTHNKARNGLPYWAVARFYNLWKDLWKKLNYSLP